ncbi:MAG: hypothetical protein EZS28_052545, partial [Streblomastix strix]
SGSYPPSITTPPELGSGKGNVIIPKQRIQPTIDHDSRSKTIFQKSLLDKSLGSPQARANSGSPNYFTLQLKRRKKADAALVTDGKPAILYKGNTTSAGSQKLKQRSNYKNQIGIEPDSEIDQPEQTEEDAKEYKIMLEDELKENIVIPIRKEQNKLYNPTFMIMKVNEEQRKILDAKAPNKQIADFHFKMHDSNEVKQTIRLGDWGTSL